MAAVLAGELGANDFISIREHLAAVSVREDGRKPRGSAGAKGRQGRDCGAASR